MSGGWAAADLIALLDIKENVEQAQALTEEILDHAGPGVPWLADALLLLEPGPGHRDGSAARVLMLSPLAL